jgi:hypothetical protein
VLVFLCAQPRSRVSWWGGKTWPLPVRFVSLGYVPAAILNRREPSVFDAQPEISRLVTAAGWPALIVEMQGAVRTRRSPSSHPDAR